jgi:predicted transcriptional regulator
MKDTTKHLASSSLKVGGGKISTKKSHPTSKTDIVISIKPQFMNLIVDRTKNHEFRKYLIPAKVERMWYVGLLNSSLDCDQPNTIFRLYVSSPDQTLRYVAVISQGKAPGSIESEDGVGNADFNAGLKQAAYAYEIKELFQLREPIPLASMQRDYGTSFPQRFAYANQSLVDAFVLADQTKLF